MIDKKNRFKDEELLHLAKKCGSNSAYKELLKRYKAYSGALAQENHTLFSNNGISRDDVNQIAFVAFLKAYDKVKDDTTSFYLYWRMIAKRDMYELYERVSTSKSFSAFGGTSFDEESYESNSTLLSEKIGKEDEEMKKEILINELLLIINEKESLFNDKEISVLKMVLKGMDYPLIAQELGISENYARVIYNNGVKKIKKNLNK